MAQWMTLTETILAQIQEHMGLPLIPLSPQVATTPASPAPPPATLVVASVVPALVASIVPPVASAALPADHPSVPT